MNNDLKLIVDKFDSLLKKHHVYSNDLIYLKNQIHNMVNNKKSTKSIIKAMRKYINTAIDVIKEEKRKVPIVREADLSKVKTSELLYEEFKRIKRHRILAILTILFYTWKMVTFTRFMLHIRSTIKDLLLKIINFFEKYIYKIEKASNIKTIKLEKSEFQKRYKIIKKYIIKSIKGAVK